MTEAPQLSVILDSPIPVYRQVVEQIRTLCVDGALAPGHALPSTRQLAGELGVHFNTIAEAYRTLATEGWLEVVQGRGVRVRTRAEPESPGKQRAQEHSSRVRHLVAELRALGFTTDWIRQQLEHALTGDPQ